MIVLVQFADVACWSAKTKLVKLLYPWETFAFLAFPDWWLDR